MNTFPLPAFDGPWLGDQNVNLYTIAQAVNQLNLQQQGGGGSTAGLSGLFVNVRDPMFAGGAKGDDVTDDLPAFNAALAYIKSLSVIQGVGALAANPTMKLFIPAGTYFLSGPLNVHVSCHIFGVGCNFGNINPGSLLRFAQNQWGVVFHEFRTTDDGGGIAGGSTGLGDASGSILEGVAIWGGGCQSIINRIFSNPSNTNRNAHGVWVRCFGVRVRDVACSFFGGNGFTINATAGSTGSTAGQANIARFENCLAQYNSMDGFSISGSDSNAAIIYGCQAISNGGCGFREYSFLGNTYIECHTRDNGTKDPIASGALGGVCTFGGHNYYIPGASNEAVQDSYASTATPGKFTTTGASGTGTTATLTFSALTSALPVGMQIVVAGVTPAGYNGTYTITASTTTSVSYSNSTTGAQSVAGTVSTAPVWANNDTMGFTTGFNTWSTAQTWRASGPYMTLPGNTNARNVFVGCYTELSQPPVQSTLGTLFVGGALDVGFDNSGMPGGQLTGTQFDGFSVRSNWSGGFQPNSFSNILQINYGTSGDVSAPGRTLISAQDTAQSNTSWQWLYDGTSKLTFQHNHSLLTEYWTLANDALPFQHIIGGLRIANPSNLFNNTALGSINQISDLNGKVVGQGDTYFYTGNTTGSPPGMGAICLTAGTVGSGAVMAHMGVSSAETTFANLPSNPHKGQMAWITDCTVNTWGTVAAGSGANSVGVIYDGSNWTVYAK